MLFYDSVIYGSVFIIENNWLIPCKGATKKKKTLNINSIYNGGLRAAVAVKHIFEECFNEFVSQMFVN